MSAHPIPAAALKTHSAILGKSGSGKTYVAKGVIESLLDEAARVCIIDPTGVYWGLKSSADGKRGAYPFVIFGGDHADLPISDKHGEAIADIVGTTATPTIIDTSMMRVGERTRFLADFGNGLLRKNSGPLHLFIDEAHLFMPQGRVADPQSANMVHAGNNLVSLGRVRGLRITLISQRPAKLHKDALTQVETLIAMRLVAPQDRKAIEEWISGQADSARAKQIIDSLPSLPVGHGWIWAPEQGVLEHAHFPAIKTFDSGASPEESRKGMGPVLAPIDIAAIQGRLQAAEQEEATAPAVTKAPPVDLAARGEPAPSGDTAGAEERGRQSGYEQALKDVQQALKALTTRSKPSLKRPAKELQQDKAQASLMPMLQPSEDIKGPADKILRALGFWRSVGQSSPSRAQVAMVATYSPKSGNFSNILGKMRSQGLIDYPTSGSITCTAAAPGRTMNFRNARDNFLDVLTGPQQRLVAAFDGSAEPLSREDLAARCGYSAKSGNFSNIVGSLVTLRVLTKPKSSAGMVALEKWAANLLADKS